MRRPGFLLRRRLVVAKWLLPDGLRFVVPVRTLNAGPNSKYFHVERGVTYYNFTSDQFSGFHGIVVPGTLHDSATFLTVYSII